jgi:hypothetical protein
MGSSNVKLAPGSSGAAGWSVKPLEWWYPLRAFAQYLPKKLAGMWQSLHVADAWCGPLRHESNWSFMMWQFTQTLGSFVRYESPSA